MQLPSLGAASSHQDPCSELGSDCLLAAGWRASLWDLCTLLLPVGAEMRPEMCPEPQSRSKHSPSRVPLPPAPSGSTAWERVLHLTQICGGQVYPPCLGGQGLGSPRAVLTLHLARGSQRGPSCARSPSPVRALWLPGCTALALGFLSARCHLSKSLPRPPQPHCPHLLPLSGFNFPVSHQHLLAHGVARA